MLIFIQNDIIIYTLATGYSSPNFKRINIIVKVNCMEYVSGDTRHNEIYYLIKGYQERNSVIAEKKQWSNYPEHIARLLCELRKYCNDEGINFNECLNSSWDYEIETQDNELHF